MKNNINCSIKNKNIICISSIDWDFIWQGHQEIMSRFVKNGNRVLYIENTGVRSPKIKDIGRIRRRIKNWKKGLGGFREVKPNLFVFSPLVIPFPYSGVALYINTFLLIRLIKRWMESASFHDPIIWTFIPTQLTINLIKQIKNQLVIYYCIDSFVDSSSGAKRIVGSEEDLFGLADLVFVTSHNLMDKALKFNDRVSFFPFGVNLEEFNSPKGDKRVVAKELDRFKRPIVGYVGGIHKWIDFNLISRMAKKRSEWTFVMVGPLQTDISRLKGQSNIIFLGGKPHGELPFLIDCFDVCIIPYLVTPYTKNVYPTKLTEYLARKKPVVGTAFFELEKFKEKNPHLIELATHEDEFIDRVEKCLSTDTDELQGKRFNAAKKNSWSGHVIEMSSLIKEAISNKERTSVSWQEQFSSFYYKKKSTVIRCGLYTLLFWILLFHTPLVWWSAKLLIIQDGIKSSDAIVVFGGGVGESGKAGQGYIERSKQAIDIYNNNFAPDVLFISGFVYLMKEVEMMKVFAIEYGIPPKQIDVETEAGNTYSYVKKTSYYAKKKNWKRIIVISSPFHMLRAKLCFSRISPELEVLYVPAGVSSFYNWPKERSFISMKQQITIQQLEGLIHEVLGIVFYKVKGYI